MGRIRILDAALADQIAAGEVVERPASVVKELLENALDAGARRLTVETRGGGVELVRVSDDGDGMDRADAVLALRRHATSKIRTAEDLTAIRTLGFRGEALPSIASVSRLVLVTRQRDADGATRVAVTAGGEPDVGDAGAAPGTTVEVHELFANVPARRKFLKSLPTESAHVADVCVRTVLARADVHVTLLRDGRTVREWLPATDLGLRARTVIDGEALAQLEGARDGVSVVALLAPPERARSGATGLYIYVNGRAVKDRTLARAVAFAYGSVLPAGRFPVGVVHVSLDPSEVDVNVHPQKAEVRFARGREVLDAVTRILAKALGVTPWVRVAEPRAEYGPVVEAILRPLLHTPGPPLPLLHTPGPPLPLLHTPGPPLPRERGATPDSSRGEGTDVGREDATDPDREHPTQPRTSSSWGRLRFLAQVRKTFIVCEGESGLVVLDQHAADERVRFHRLREQYRAKAPSAQRLLFPERVEVTAGEVALVEEARDELLAVGLDVTSLGASTVAVHAVPAIVKRAAPERLLRDVLDELSRRGERAFGDAIDMALATMACHGAIRAGDVLAPDECQALLAALDEVSDFAGHCPHGRPIVYAIPFDELARKVGR